MKYADSSNSWMINNGPAYSRLHWIIIKLFEKEEEEDRRGDRGVVLNVQTWIAILDYFFAFRVRLVRTSRNISGPGLDTVHKQFGACWARVAYSVLLL